MRDQLFCLHPHSRENLQQQIRELLIKAILNGQLPRASPIPSCREMANRLGVSRNTVVLAYGRLVEDGFLVSQERSGYYVASELPSKLGGATAGLVPALGLEAHWDARLKMSPSVQRNISKPVDWSRYPFPFVYGQPDLNLFPFDKWRECARDAITEKAIRDWACDQVDHDDALLVEQLQSTVLPRRGIWAKSDEILITMGTQQALYTIAELFMAPGVTVGIENPGYVDARNIFGSSAARLIGLPVDGDGLIVDEGLRACDIIYVTPSHQVPTTVTMSRARRSALLELAHDADLILIEDDYDSETNFVSEPTQALKSLDQSGRVIYVGSLSKSLSPGLRLGYLVAPPRVIQEARALRRLMIRHPPSNTQAATALFLARGYHDMLVRKLWNVYRTRWELMHEAIDRYLPDMSRFPTLGGTSFWMVGPPELHCIELAADAAKAGILIEPGDVHFMAQDPPMECFRLGFSAAPESCIEEGIRRLAALVQRHLKRHSAHFAVPASTTKQ
jgi:GntR family transcriptional regulator/MocR family aminotransferase